MEIPTLFFEHHPNPMLIFDTDTLRILEVNESAVRKYGYSRDEFRQITIEDMRPPEDIPLLREELRKLGGQSRILNIGTYRHRTKEGDILYVQISTQPFPMEKRSARIVHVHDMTETVLLQKKVEEAYRDQQHHIEHNPLGMVKYDENLRIIEWSKRAEQKTGYNKDEVLGKSSFELALFEESDIPFMKDRLHRLSNGGKDTDRFETRLRLKSGSFMQVRVHASALRGPEGRMKSILAFIENISRQKDYGRQMEERERKYHRLFEDANDGIFLMNDMTFIDCNQRATEIFKASKNEILGKSPIDFSPVIQPDGTASREKARELIRRVREGKPQVFEWKHQTTAGDEIDVEVSLNKIELGENGYIQAIVRDLTEHKKIKHDLEEERSRLQRAQQLARIGWWSYDPGEDRIMWSDVLFDILEVDRAAFGASFDDFYRLVHPDDRPLLKQVMQQARTSEETVDYVLRILTPDGNVIYAKCRAQSRLDEKEQMVHLSGTLQDITDRHKAEVELQRREQLFESLFVDAPVAIVMVDPDGRVQKTNQSFEALFGYTDEQLRGEDLLKYLLPEDRYNTTRQQYEQSFIENKHKATYYEDKRVTKNGQLKDVFIGSLPVFGDGEAIAAFGIYTDITDLKKTQQNLEDSLREQEVLLAEIHHRVKNNLAIISGLLELEAMNWEDDTIVSQVLMQSKLRIHSMAKIHEKLYQSGSFSNLNLENYIVELVDTISVSMQRAKKEVEVQVDCDDVYLNINQALPCALLINELVTNAFKYAFNAPQEGKLVIRFKDGGDSARIEVRDNGPGLPQEFHRMAEDSLGHRLVQQLVKQLDGDIAVESGDKEGTHYKISFKKAEKSGSASNYLIQ